MRSLSLALFVVLVCTTFATATPKFYLTTDPNGGTPGDLNLDFPLNSTGTLYLAADTDVRLSQLEIDVASYNPFFLAFTNAMVTNNGRYAVLTGPPTVVDIIGAEIDHIGGAAIPGFLGTGIGPGSGVANPTVIAALSYKVSSSPGATVFGLRIGEHGVSNWDNKWTDVQFGANPALIPNINGGGGLFTEVGYAETLTPEPTSALLMSSAIVAAFGLLRHRR